MDFFDPVQNHAIFGRCFALFCYNDKLGYPGKKPRRDARTKYFSTTMK